MGLLSELKSIEHIVSKKFDIVFYAENEYYRQYYEPLLTNILRENTFSVCYITSDSNDPFLKNNAPQYEAYYLKHFLGYVTGKVKAIVFITTTPGLKSHLFKKSKFVSKYIYMFHSSISTHQQYRKEAFFYFDSVFCLGSYHKNELQEAEEIYQLPKKELIEYGYPLFERIRNKNFLNKQTGNKKTVLIAPSWHDGCILNTCIDEIINHLKNREFEVHIRPHPEFKKKFTNNYLRIKRLVQTIPGFFIDESPDVIESIANADVLITDRSGIAMEFAFGKHIPVFFIDTPPKAFNPDMGLFTALPVEDTLRHQIGIQLPMKDIALLNGMIDDILKNANQKNLVQLEGTIFYNAETGYQNGFSYITKLIAAVKRNKM